MCASMHAQTYMSALLAMGGVCGAAASAVEIVAFDIVALDMVPHRRCCKMKRLDMVERALACS